MSGVFTDLVDSLSQGVDAATATALSRTALAAVAGRGPAERTEAQAAVDRFEAVRRGAFSRYPAVSSGGFHSGDADPRSMALFRTMSYVREAGLYAAGDLIELAASAEIEEEWLTGEWLRLGALVLTMGTLVRGLDDGTVPAAVYPDRVRDVATEFAGLRVGPRRGGRTGPQ